ncbi:NADPH-Fe(3+) oxidoreductase subunit beta [subsurface metagenome]|nr:FAD-dependent oxidoreductase [bacterium]
MASSRMSVAERRRRERKKRLTALILSLFLPGLGQLATGRIGIGIAALILDAGFVLFPLTMIRIVVIQNELTNLTWLIWLLWGVTFGLYYFLVAYDAYRGTRLLTAPCRGDCPAEINVSDYVALVAAGRYAEALELIRERAPLAATLGRICPAPCENVCTRTRIEEPVAIRALKRSAGEHSGGESTNSQFTVKHPQKVAVVGAGASGLSCVYFLAKRGYSVDIFDREEQPGGLLSTTIPCFRLPREVLKEDIDFILSSSKGIRFTGGKILGENLDLGELEHSYDAVYLALGAAKPRPLMIEGEELKGVIPGLSFLRDVCTGAASSFSGHVAVLGGGNTAVDSARAALRLGAKKVTLFYRRTREHMPAYVGEVAEAEKEGVKIKFLAAPLRFEGKDRVERVRFGRMRLRDHGKGRRSELEAVEGEEWNEEVEAVIVAVGQEADYAVLKELTLASDIEGKIKVHSRHLRTNRRKVFAGGDMVRGPATVVEAVADGRKAAQAIDFFLRPRFLPRFFEHIADFDPDFGLERLEGAAWTEKKPVVKSRVKEQTNYKNPGLYVETICGLTGESDQEEAKRCLRCQRYNVGFAYRNGKQKGYLSLDER